MNNFEQSTHRSDAGIPNTIIETLFLRGAEDEQMQAYNRHLDNGRTSLATAYASNDVISICYPTYNWLENTTGMTMRQLAKLFKSGITLQDLVDLSEGRKTIEELQSKKKNGVK